MSTPAKPTGVPLSRMDLEPTNVGVAPGVSPNGTVQSVRRDSHRFVDEEVFLDPKPHVERLRSFLAAQNFEEGIPEAERTYELIQQWCAEDFDNADKYIALMEVIRLGWGMQYLVVNPKRRNSAEWRKRAQEVCDNMHRRQEQIKARHGADYEVRSQVILAELRFFLVQAQMAWKEIYERGRNASKEQCARNALKFCEAQEEHSNRYASDGELWGRLNSNLKFHELLALGHRMRGNILEGSYLWHPDWEMRDADMAEKLLFLNPEYFESIQKVSLRELQACVRFYEEHLEVEPPREILYAYMEIARHMKIKGQYAEAWKFANQLRDRFEKSADAITWSRYLNLIGEIQIVLAQHLLNTEFSGRKIHFLQQARRMYEAADETELVVLLLQNGRERCTEAFRVADEAQKRVVQESLSNCTITMLEYNLERRVRNEVVQEGKGGFARRAYTRCTTELMEFDDDSWFFFEAWALAKLWEEAKRQGGEADIFEKVPREHFEAAAREIDDELSNRRPKVPEQYYSALEEKRACLGRLLS